MAGGHMQHNSHTELLNSINILCYENWPEEVYIQYGDENVRKRCGRFSRGFR
jgi:hypothetical protein